MHLDCRLTIAADVADLDHNWPVADLVFARTLDGRDTSANPDLDREA